MTEVSVKTKMWGLIILMLLFIIGVGGVGFVTLKQQMTTFQRLDDLDDAFLSMSAKIALNILELRRYEKDYFLNIGNPDRQEEYLKKFQEVNATLPQLMKKLLDLAQTDEHLAKDLHNKVTILRGPYNDYLQGFNATVQRLRADRSLTPQQANLLMEQYKANIPVLEETIAAVVQAGNESAERASAQAIRRGQEARMVIIVAIIIAVVLAGVLGSALCHSIYRAIFREGLRRMAHRV